MFKRGWIFTKTLAGKFTSWKRFKASVYNGYHASKDDVKATLQSRNAAKIGGRIGMELLGIAVGIVFLPLPGPNPAIFISPTTRKFFFAFVKDPLPPELEKPKINPVPEQPPATEKPEDKKSP